MFWKKCFIKTISQQGVNLGMWSKTFKRCKILPAFCGHLCIFKISTLSGGEKWIQPQVPYHGDTLVVTHLPCPRSDGSNHPANLSSNYRYLFHHVCPFGQSNCSSQKMLAGERADSEPLQSETTLEIMVMCSPREPPPTVILFSSPDSHIGCVVGSCNAHQPKKASWRPKSGMSDDLQGKVVESRPSGPPKPRPDIATNDKISHISDLWDPNQWLRFRLSYLDGVSSQMCVF